MKRIHYTDSYLLSPYHPVSVFVIGAGGTGSQVVTNLARMDVALRSLGHPGLHVTVLTATPCRKRTSGDNCSVRLRSVSTRPWHS